MFFFLGSINNKQHCQLKFFLVHVLVAAKCCTEKEFLMQKLPEVLSSSLYPSSCPKGRMWILIWVQPWDVMRKIEDFLQVTNLEKYDFDMFPQHFNEKFNVGDEKFVTHCLLREITEFLVQKYPHTDFMVDREVSLAIPSNLSGSCEDLSNFYAQNPPANFVISQISKNLVVFEVKSGGLRRIGSEGWPLHNFVASRSCNSGCI